VAESKLLKERKEHVRVAPYLVSREERGGVKGDRKELPEGKKVTNG